MSIDWEQLRSLWSGVRSMPRESAHSASAFGVEQLLQAMLELYRQYDMLVHQLQSADLSLSRQISTLQVMLTAMDAQLSSALTAMSVPGGRALYALQHHCTLHQVEYDAVSGGYRLRPSSMQRPLVHHPLSSVQVEVVMASGEATLTGEASALYDQSDDTSVQLSVLHQGVPMLEPDSGFIPTSYRGGAVACIAQFFYHVVYPTRIKFQTAEPVSVLGYGVWSHNWSNFLNLWSDAYCQSAQWVRADGNAVSREWDSDVSRNDIALSPHGPDCLVSIPPQPVQVQPGRLSYSQFDRCLYMAELSYVVHEAPLDVTLTLSDETGMVLLRQTRRVSPGGRLADFINFLGAGRRASQIGVTIGVRQVGNRAGKLWVRALRVCDWMWIKDLSLDAGTSFDIPIHGTAPGILGVCVVVSTTHSEIDEQQQALRYFCHIKRFEPVTELFASEGRMVSPAIQQETHPITAMHVFLDGDNLDNSSIVVGSDGTFRHSVVLPAQEAELPHGAEVRFVPSLDAQTPTSGYSVVVPVQNMTESFSHGNEFQLRYVPYCHPRFLRSSLARLGRYEPNLDLSEVDPARLADLGQSVANISFEQVESSLSQWSGRVLGLDAAVADAENGFYVSGVLPPSTGPFVATQAIHAVEDVFLFNEQTQPFTVGAVVESGRFLTKICPDGTEFITDWDVPDKDKARLAYDIEPLNVSNFPPRIGRPGVNYMPPGQQADICDVADYGEDVSVETWRAAPGWSWSRVYTHTYRGAIPGRKSLVIDSIDSGSGGPVPVRISFPNGRLISSSPTQNTERGYVRLPAGRYSVEMMFVRPGRCQLPGKLHAIGVDVRDESSELGYRTVLEQTIDQEIGDSVVTRTVEFSINNNSDCRIWVVVSGAISLSFPRIRAYLSPTSASSTSSLVTMTWDLPHHLIQQRVWLYLGRLVPPVSVSSGQGIGLRQISVSGFQVDPGGTPVMDTMVMVNNVWRPVNLHLYQFTPGTEGGTFTEPSWLVQHGGALAWMVIGLTKSASTGNKTISVQMYRRSYGVSTRPAVSLLSYSATPPSDTTVRMVWRGNHRVSSTDELAVVLRLNLLGIDRGALRMFVNGRGSDVFIFDDLFVDRDVEREVKAIAFVSGQSEIHTIELVASAPLGDSARDVMMFVQRNIRLLSRFDALAPVKLTVSTPQGVMRPDVIGPVPIGGTRVVENERLVRASDQLLEQYEQAVLSGVVSRRILTERPVYATAFAPLASDPTNQVDADISISLVDRSTGAVVRRLGRDEYVVDRERGLIQLLRDIGADHLLECTYRFHVVSEAQLKLYERRVRAELITRNRTDYIHNTVPELRPFRFGVDENTDYTVLEYYHQGNKLVLSQEVPPPVDARYGVTVSYWYIPVTPALELRLRVTPDGRVPVVRKVVVQV